MKTTTSGWFGTACMAASLLVSTPESGAVAPSLSGIYSSTATQTQVHVINGKPRSNSILNGHQTFSSTFVETTNNLINGVIRVTYSFTETADSSTFVVRYFDASTGDLLLTFTSSINVTVTSQTSTEYNTRTVWNMKMTSSLLGSFPLTSETITEGYRFDLSRFTCAYTYNGGTLTLTRSGTGTGLGQGSPLIPRVPNWTRLTPLNFPILNPTRTVWCDPPFASSFQYTVTPGRKERISSVTLPKGFGPKIQILAQPSNGGANRLVGTFKSGAKVNLLKRPGLSKGTSRILIRNIKPRVDLKKRAPYPVGLNFTGLDQSAARIRIQARQITR